jgi:Ca-activated chloride channel family protein
LGEGEKAMIFHSPWAFWLILPVLAAALWAFLNRRKKQASLLYSQTSLLASVRPTLRTRLMFLPQALKVLALILAIVALARPQTSDTLMKKNVEGIDIMIALDISDSMLIEDMKPLNRLESAKETLKNFVNKRSSDRIGVIIFAGESFTLVPLTLDYPLILSRIDEITTAQQAHIKDGTAIGVALANAAGKLKESTAKNRVIIFMTDGENNSGTIDPDTALEVAKGYGLKIYSIGIGRDGPTRIPIYQKDVFGNRVKTYQPFESTVNEDLLGRMASQTGGKYYRASKEDSLAGIFNEIDRLEKTKIDVNKYTRYTELFPRYLMAAFVFYLLAIFLSHTWLRRLP